MFRLLGIYNFALICKIQTGEVEKYKNKYEIDYGSGTYWNFFNFSDRNFKKERRFSSEKQLNSAQLLLSE